MPTDPFGGGAMYHSMSGRRLLHADPRPRRHHAVHQLRRHGLLLTAGDYRGPVVCLEPKWMYRQTLGPAFPGEPTDPRARSRR
jgi:2-oxoisovalerate dehydrogenase E1 component